MGWIIVVFGEKSYLCKKVFLLLDGFNGDDCIMKQENNKKRTEEELCHDITARAEKLHVLKPKVKYVMLAVVLALFALGALNSHYKWFVMDKWWWAWLGIVVLWFLVFYVIIRQLINGMRRAATPREYLRKAKWLKRSVKIRNSLWLIIPFMPVLGNVMDVGELTAILLCLGLMLVFGFVAGGIDSAFSDDLHELEYRLED